MLAIALLALLLAVFLYGYLRSQFWVLFDSFPDSNPFQELPAGPKPDLVTDAKERDRVLKQSFSEDKVPAELDAIVIGSGMGGLSVAALLAKSGKKVLVLEQHDQAGGCCHSFVDKGFEFDTGIHYIGEMSEGTVSRFLLDQLSNGKMEWVQLEEVYDTVVFGSGDQSAELKRYPVPSGRGQLMKSLIESFPAEEKAIRSYFDLLKKVRKAIQFLGLLKLLPLWFANLVISSGFLRWMVPVVEYYTRSLSDVLDELTDNQELKAVLAYSYGDYGTAPKKASFFMHATLTNHFTHGGYYPKGGASEIAFNIIPTIEEAGGKVLVRAKVVEIVMDEAVNRAIGVRVKKGHNFYEIIAPVVISDAGLHNTFEKLLPPVALQKFGLGQLLKRVEHGVGLLSVFVGLEGTKEELGLKASNIWAFQNADLDGVYEKYVKLSPDEVMKSPVPLLFVSFPSTKDPTYNDRYPGKTTCAIVTVTPYEWFEQWTEEKVMHRGHDYESLKMTIGRQMWNQVCELFPQLEDKLEYLDVGTPLSNQYYLGTSRGEVYGIDHNKERFSPEMIAKLRPDVGVPGLYLTGQDTFICGFSGAMYGGVACASTVLGRNLLGDLLKAKAKVKKTQKKAQ